MWPGHISKSVPQSRQKLASKSSWNNQHSLPDPINEPRRNEREEYMQTEKKWSAVLGHQWRRNRKRCSAYWQTSKDLWQEIFRCWKSIHLPQSLYRRLLWFLTQVPRKPIMLYLIQGLGSPTFFTSLTFWQTNNKKWL